jgi:hypothetical protein
MRGYFWAQQFQGRAAQATADELALNPDHFAGRTDKEILSTLVHEMTHVWQQTFGNPGRRGYHNLEWAFKMKSLGLYPSSTGAKDGAETGERVSHYIVHGEGFDVACERLSAKGFHLNWQARSGSQGVGGQKSPGINSRAGRASERLGQTRALLICGECYEDSEGEIRMMEAEG